MTHGGIRYLRDLAQRGLVLAAGRAKTIAETANANYEAWPTMTLSEKDAANRQAQRAVAELARMNVRLIKYAVDDLSREA